MSSRAVTHPVLTPSRTRGAVLIGQGHVARSPGGFDATVEVGYDLTVDARLSWSAWDSGGVLPDHYSWDDLASAAFPKVDIQGGRIGRAREAQPDPVYQGMPLSGRHYVGRCAGLSEVRFGIVNGPEVPYGCRGVVLPGKRVGHANRLSIAAGAWRVILDNFKPASSQRPNVVTHIGSLSRSDRRTFSLKSAEAILARLSLGLSFLRGAHSGLLLPIGYVSDQPSCVLLASPRVDPLSVRPLTWYNPQIEAAAIQGLLGACLLLDRGNSTDEVTRMALHYAIQAQKAPVEAGLANGMAGLEYLADDEYWPIYKPQPGATRKTFENLAAYQRVGAIADRHRLPGTQRDIAALLRKSTATAPATATRRTKLVSHVAWARNRHMHAEAARRHAFPDQMWREAWFLSTEWLSVMLLKRLGYSGKYASRLGRWPKWDYDLTDLP